jgi:hypothetical protein
MELQEDSEKFSRQPDLHLAVTPHRKLLHAIAAGEDRDPVVARPLRRSVGPTTLSGGRDELHGYQRRGPCCASAVGGLPTGTPPRGM